MPDLPLGIYVVSAVKPGFQQQESKVEVVVSRVSSVSFKLPVSSQSSTVEVSASVVDVETQSTTLTGIVNTKTVADLPMNGRDFRQMLKLSPGVNPVGNSINGNRTRGNNFQIDGADNNDGFQNASAVNQGGVAGIAGTLLPVEAIDQFSVATNGSAEMGRNGGGVVNLVIKSGTNSLHGSGYYFNRNEYFAANSPFATPGSKVRRIRNGQGGFSLGGPIIKNKTLLHHGRRAKGGRGECDRHHDAVSRMAGTGPCRALAVRRRREPSVKKPHRFLPHADSNRPGRGEQFLLV
jgi:outer membrane receptor for ferrienterochelin and colicin